MPTGRVDKRGTRKRKPQKWAIDCINPNNSEVKKTLVWSLRCTVGYGKDFPLRMYEDGKSCADHKCNEDTDYT
jgi:hypothetical protein